VWGWRWVRVQLVNRSLHRRRLRSAPSCYDSHYNNMIVRKHLIMMKYDVNHFKSLNNLIDWYTLLSLLGNAMQCTRHLFVIDDKIDLTPDNQHEGRYSSDGDYYWVLQLLYALNEKVHGKGAVVFRWQTGGSHIATSGIDNIVRIFDKNGECVEQIPMPG
jgi:hypothetical protein